ncbi:MAG: type II toxin-antitoxin system CcdA family antitoxin [Candidatus Magnetobacterium sp. LHC-1]|nr:type II toxin-antitoxin system CcdA family antitoxin [Nitrospirota bacterium]
MVRTSVTLPEELIEEARQYLDNFSSFVATALRQHIRKKNRESHAELRQVDKQRV